MTDRFVSYSANAEDVLLHRIFGGQAHGFYVDVGAADPRMENDCKALYDRGWSGVNVEPNPSLHAALQRDRPRDRSYALALADTDGEQRYWEVEGTGLSTLDEAEAARCRTGGWTVVERIVETRTLASLLEEVAPQRFDVLKVDVEGWEERVLRGNDWRRWRPSVTVVEATLPERPERRETGIAAFLAEQGYRHAWFDGLNDWFVRRDFGGADHAFDAPPNVFDHADSYVLLEARAHAAQLEQHLAVAKGHADAEHAARLAKEAALTELDALALRRGAELEVERAGVAERASLLLHGLRDRENENERLRLSVARLHTQTEHYAAQLEDTHREREELLILRRQIAALHGDVRGLDARLRDSQADTERQRRLGEEAQGWLSAIRGSTSWRLTLPMRVTGRALGRMRRRLGER